MRSAVRTTRSQSRLRRSRSAPPDAARPSAATGAPIGRFAMRKEHGRHAPLATPTIQGTMMNNKVEHTHNLGFRLGRPRILGVLGVVAILAAGGLYSVASAGARSPRHPSRGVRSDP